MAPRDFCSCIWTKAYRWILPHSLMKKLGLNWLELLVEHSPTAGGFAEAASTELCKRNVEEIADIELDCTGTHPLAKWNNSLLSLAVECINVFGFTTFYLCCHPWFSCSSDVFGGCGFTVIYFWNFSVWYKGKTWLGLLSLFLNFDFVEQNEDFRRRKY